MSSDLPLRQVVTDTWEVGLRGKPELAFLRKLSWSFVSSVELGTGYFQNFARTRREGFHANIDGAADFGRLGRLAWGLDYTFLEATYQSSEVVDASANNTSDTALSGSPGLDGNIYVHPGNRIPLILKQTGKASADDQATSEPAFDVDAVTVSCSCARGNENDAYKADGVYYLGPGISPGYDLTKRLGLAVQIDNLFDKHYFTAEQLANTGLNAQGAVITRPSRPAQRDPKPGTIRHRASHSSRRERRVALELSFSSCSELAGEAIHHTSMGVRFSDAGHRLFTVVRPVSFHFRRVIVATHWPPHSPRSRRTRWESQNLPPSPPGVATRPWRSSACTHCT